MVLGSLWRRPNLPYRLLRPLLLKVLSWWWIHRLHPLCLRLRTTILPCHWLPLPPVCFALPVCARDPRARARPATPVAASCLSPLLSCLPPIRSQSTPCRALCRKLPTAYLPLCLLRSWFWAAASGRARTFRGRTESAEPGKQVGRPLRSWRAASAGPRLHLAFL